MGLKDETKYSAEYISKIAEKIQSIKNKAVSYRCYGTINERNIVEYISCTEEEKDALQSIQAIYPEKPLFLLLPIYEEEYGFGRMHLEIEGEDNFQVEHIDWNPVYTYDFSFEFNGLKGTECVELDNQEYSELMSFCIKERGYILSLHMFSNPMLCGKILRRISDRCSSQGLIFDKSLKVFMDEIEADKEILFNSDL